MTDTGPRGASPDGARGGVSEAVRSNDVQSWNSCIRPPIIMATSCRTLAEVRPWQSRDRTPRPQTAKHRRGSPTRWREDIRPRT